MKFNLKTVVLLFVFILAGTITQAQSIGKSGLTMEDDNGNVLKFSDYTDLVGSPFFNTDWVKGSAKFKDGTTQDDVYLKYDEKTDNIYTEVEGAQPARFRAPVVEFTIAVDGGGTTRFSIFPGNGKTADDAYFEVLSDGKVKLLKKNAKSISESKDGIGTAVITRLVVDNIDYYLLIDGKAVKIKKDKKTVEAALGNKQTELEAYIKTNNLNVKKDGDLAKLITYYNTL